MDDFDFVVGRVLDPWNLHDSEGAKVARLDEQVPLTELKNCTQNMYIDLMRKNYAKGKA